MLKNSYNLDIYIAELIEADHYLNEAKKDVLLNQVKKYSEHSTILQTFLF